jgi:EpsI family protein
MKNENQTLLRSKRVFWVCLLLFVTGVINVGIVLRTSRAAPTMAVPRIPYAKQGWVATPFPVRLGEDENTRLVLSRKYQKAGHPPIHLLILYNQQYTYGVDSHMPAICYRGAGWRLREPISFATLSKNIRLTGFRGESENGDILVYYGFSVGGRIVTDGFYRKFYEVLQTLKTGGCRHLLVEVTVTFQPGRVAPANQSISNFLEILEPNLVASQ